ncbi:MAG: carboxylating nicotinate-nucleotide diphosphorylase [Candidatus Atribacteria bacterium]|nr:carboxylating nicotinate-nucleotide diphosphorylase [Candidatus Atribacteria bacterium]MCD6350406.1 carboxylating nicotinate-nucleotide diphosphorylase [Candidatus Atribacteria bacterium]
MKGLVPWDIDRRLQAFLEEDLGFDDITTQGLGELSLLPVKAIIKAKTDGIMAGGPFAVRIFSLLDPEIQYTILVEEGSAFHKDDILIELRGAARGILMGERVALNLLQRLCGIATRTRMMVEAVKDLPVKVADTRKTNPGLRIFEKYAVRCGGGINHRLGLYDCVLIKDNHIELCGSVKEAIRRIKPFVPFTAKIAVECRSLQEVEEALEEKADVIMLDNMPLETMRKAINLVKNKAIVEVSGGVDPTSIRFIAELGPDIISTGYVTHQATWIDISLSVEKLDS